MFLIASNNFENSIVQYMETCIRHKIMSGIVFDEDKSNVYVYPKIKTSYLSQREKEQLEHLNIKTHVYICHSSIQKVDKKNVISKSCIPVYATPFPKITYLVAEDPIMQDDMKRVSRRRHASTNINCFYTFI